MGKSSYRTELRALKNQISEAELILSTTTLPEGRTLRLVARDTFNDEKIAATVGISIRAMESRYPSPSKPSMPNLPSEGTGPASHYGLSADYWGAILKGGTHVARDTRII